MTGFRLKAPLFETCQSLFVHVQGHQVMVWDLHNEEVVTVFDGHTADIRSISCLALPTGIMVCTSSYEVTLLWDAVSGTVLNDLPAARTAVLYRHDSRIRAMLAVKDTIQVWDFNGTAKAAISTLSGHKADVTAIALIVPPSSTSSLRLGRPRLTALSASEDGTMKAWSLDKGECEYTIEGAGQIDTLSVADARFAVSMSGQEKTLKVWDLRSNYRCAFQQSTLSASDGDSIPQLISLAIEDTTPDPTKDGKLVKLWKTARKDKEIFRFFVDEPANYVYIEPRQVLIGSADGSPFFSYKAR
jgi:WD40 repeat protein